LSDLREILYKELKSGHNDGGMSKLSNFEHSRWRPDLHFNVTKADATIYCLVQGLVVSTIAAKHLLNDKIFSWFPWQVRLPLTSSLLLEYSRQPYWQVTALWRKVTSG